MERFDGDLVELEGIAVTADECVTALPVLPTGKYRRTYGVSTCSSARPPAGPAGCWSEARTCFAQLSHPSYVVLPKVATPR